MNKTLRASSLSCPAHTFCRAVGLALTALSCAARPAVAATPAEPVKPRVIRLDFPIGQEGRGSVVTADLDGDGKMDFVVTALGHVGAYRHDGQRLWHLETEVRVSAGSSESVGLPGHDAPGVQVADVDGDGRAELLHLDQSSTVHVRDAATGREQRAVRLSPPAGAERWEHLVVANLRGRGDRDLVLQATNAKGYRMGRYVAAYATESLDGAPLWQIDRFGALAHGPLRVADLNGDGRDEVCGYTILGPDGQQTAWRYPPISPENAGGASFHIDSLFIADVRPDVPGREVVLLEEGRNYVALLNFDRGIVWWTTNDRQEPQNAAVGEFDAGRPGLEIWCRSRYDTHQKPWVLDAKGNLLVQYELDRVAPPGWTEKGVEEIVAIHWTGSETQLAAAKERHKSGDVCLFEPLSGRFVARFPERADRLYVADVSGDWREEVIVVNGNELHLYENPAKNPRPGQPRLWTQQHYRRSKMTWNYYSP
jgi:hypothetical protein